MSEHTTAAEEHVNPLLQAPIPVWLEGQMASPSAQQPSSGGWWQHCVCMPACANEEKCTRGEVRMCMQHQWKRCFLRAHVHRRAHTHAAGGPSSQNAHQKLLVSNLASSTLLCSFIHLFISLSSSQPLSPPHLHRCFTSFLFAESRRKHHTSVPASSFCMHCPKPANTEAAVWEIRVYSSNLLLWDFKGADNGTGGWVLLNFCIHWNEFVLTNGIIYGGPEVSTHCNLWKGRTLRKQLNPLDDTCCSNSTNFCLFGCYQLINVNITCSHIIATVCC